MLNSLYIGNQGGGIISTVTQVPQSEEPVVIVGLGGTGVDAITRLKTKLQKQIQPDNLEDVRNKGDEPQYGHIKFLGIDADRKWLENSGLSQAQGETLNIQNYNYNVIFAPDKLDALKQQREMQWMSVDYMSNHLPPNPDGAGAYRQFGRWLTIAKASEIRTKLRQVITQACTGRNGGQLNVHIITGISGGMGAGSFADICYIAREVIDGLGFAAAKVFGYFVLPDAIISKDAIIGNPIKTAANERNGMASLLEIEHLMNLKDSHEWFDQDYGSFQIHTQHKLVDMCHFVSATNMDGVPVANGYEYALNVIGDYILAFVSREQVADGAAPITMTGNLANAEADLSGINPEHGRGYSQNYHLIGAANAEIPTTQMATYLASQLFGKFTIRTQMPDNSQIEQFAASLNLTDERFKQLENQMAQGAVWTPITEQLVSQYYDQIKANMNTSVLPNALVEPTDRSLRQRKGLLAQKRESMGKDIQTYVYQAGASSIPGLALNSLIQMAENPGLGPIFAYGMMNKTGADIFHYLDGRLKYYSLQRQEARNQEAFFTNGEPAAKRKLGTSGIFNKKANIKEYAAVLGGIYYWQAQADLFEEMEKLMADLITAFQSINKKYLQPLHDITKELMETFAANRTYFRLGRGNQSQDGFTKQLVKFSDLQPRLDAALNALDPAAETGGLLKLLTASPQIWMEREELKLKAKVSAYILREFQGILSGSLESFLRENLNMIGANDNTFVQAILTGIIQPFVKEAAPIFWTSEPLVGDNTKTAHRSVLTVPSIANCVCAAADIHKGADNRIEVRKSLVNDRIYILRTISGVPMHAYQGLLQYLGTYEGYSELGLHLYERNVDWRKILTFPYPYSYVPQYTRNADELLALYAEAIDKGIIYFEGEDPQGNRGGNAFVKLLAEVGTDLLDRESLQTNGRMDLGKAQERIAALENILHTPTGALPILSKGNLSGNSLVRDNFLRFYGIAQLVRQEVGKYDNITQTIAEIQEAMGASSKMEKLRKNFFDSILVGLFEDDGFNMTYKYVEFGMEKTLTLCDNTMPYSGLSKYYQAFCTMLAADAGVQADIDQNANSRFNSLSPQEKKERLGKLRSMYNPQVLAMISQNYAGKLEQKEIDGFYASFIQYLDNLNVMLQLTGALV